MVKTTKITVDDATRNRIIGSEEGLRAVLDGLKVTNLVIQKNGEYFEVADFDALEDGGQYTLGDAQPQQFLQPLQQLDQYDTIEVTLLYGRKRETCVVMKNELSLSAILKKARELLKIPIAALAFSCVKERTEIPLEDNKDVALHITRPNLNACIIRVKNLQEGFSSFTSIKDALRLVDATSDNDKLPVSDDKFPKPFTEFSEPRIEELLHAMDTIRRLKEVVPIEQSVEATSGSIFIQY